MFRNYLITALRNITRNRLTTFLHLLGLSLGFAAALFALLYVRHETSYDRFIPGHERIAVVVLHQTIKGVGTGIGEKSPAYFAGWMKLDFSGIETARLRPDELTVGRGAIESSEHTGWVDPKFFRMLPLPVLAGDVVSALERPDAVVITQRIARKYFGRDTPIGETLTVERTHVFQIAAVIEDLPAATHLSPEIFGSGLNREFGLLRYDEVPWPVDGQTPVITYIQTADGTPASLSALQTAMPAFVQRHMGRLFELIKGQYAVEVTLVPLARLHLFPNGGVAMKPHGNPAILGAAGAVGLLIAAIALINFVNLMTARSDRRAAEVGVRKVSGAEWLHLMSQYIGESLIYTFGALAVAAALVTLGLPIVDAALVPGIAAQWPALPVMVLAGGFAFAAGILGGFYPAFLLSGLRPAAVLKGRVHAAGSGGGRHALVALQFGVLIALTLATMVVQRQIAFSLRDGLRFPQDQMVFVYAHCPTPFTEALHTLRGVTGIACASGDPSNFGPRSFTVGTRGDGTQVSLGIGSIGFGFFELLGVRPVAGRLYDPARDAAAAEDQRVPLAILNESAVRAMGFASAEAAIGHGVATIENRGGQPSEVIGVVPDFTFDLQSTRIPPMIYWVKGRYDRAEAAVYLKLSGRDVPETLAAIDALWKRVGDPHPIRRLFVDQHLQDMYLATLRQRMVIGGLTATAVIIAVLGLFGLSAFSAEARTKEVGIRKAMGAAQTDILRLMLAQFMKPVLLANVIAWPVGYFVMQRWLEGFAYHIDLSPWMFLAASALALLIAILTVIGQALLVARAQPVTALRYE